MKGRSAALGLLLLLSAGCGADESTSKPRKPEMADVGGTVAVDSVYSLRYRKATDACVAINELGQTLAVGQSPVVIKDAEGTEVALGKITSTHYGTYDDKGQTYVDQTHCEFNFDAGKVPIRPGVYSAAVPDLDVTVRFTPRKTSTVVIPYKETH